MLLNGLHGHRAPLRLTDHAQEPGFFQDEVRELIHAGGGGRPRRPHHFIANRIYRADVVDEPARQIDALGKPFPAFDEALHALMGRVPARQHAARKQNGFPRLPAGHLFLRHRIQIHPSRGFPSAPADLRPGAEIRGRLQGRARPIKHKVRVARGRAVRNHGHGQGGRVGGVVQNFHVEDRGEPAQALRTDAQGVHRIHDFKAQFFHSIGGTASPELMDVNGAHEGFLGHHRRLFCGAADADAQHARRAPAGPHGGHGFHHPIHDGIGGVQHGELALVLRTATLSGHGHVHRIPGDKRHVNHRRGVVLRVLPRPCRIGQHRGPEHIIGMEVGLADAFVDHVLEA